MVRDMTFTDRVVRRRQLGVLLAFVGLVMVALVAAVLLFALKVGLGEDLQGWRWQLILAVAVVMGTVAFAGGWAARSSLSDSVDLQIRDMGPVQRALFASAITEEGEAVLRERVATQGSSTRKVG